MPVSEVMTLSESMSESVSEVHKNLGHGLGHELMSEVVSVSVHLWFDSEKIRLYFECRQLVNFIGHVTLGNHILYVTVCEQKVIVSTAPLAT